MKLLAIIILLLPLSAFAQLEMQWVESFGGDQYDMIYDHIETSDSGFAFTGYTRPDRYSIGGVWLGKTNRDGELLWDHCHEFVKEDEEDLGDKGYALFEQEDGSFLVMVIGVQLTKNTIGRIRYWFLKLMQMETAFYGRKPLVVLDGKEHIKQSVQMMVDMRLQV